MEPTMTVEVANALAGGYVKAAAVFSAGICMGIGALGPALGECYAAAKGIEAMGKIPEQSGMLLRNILIVMAVGETTGIYSLVIALLLLFAVG